MRPRAATYYEGRAQREVPRTRGDMERALSHRRNAPASFNAMVVGRVGVGKSTLLQTLCDSFYSIRLNSLEDMGCGPIFDNQRDCDKSKEVTIDPFCLFNTTRPTEDFRHCKIVTSDVDNMNKINVELIDTPGIDSQDLAKARQQVNKIQWAIEQRLQTTVQDEIQARRSKHTRNRHIHAIIYMLAPPVHESAFKKPHSPYPESAMDLVTKTDLMAITQLGQFANIILVFGKCDTIDRHTKEAIRKGSFFRQLRERVEPAKLFDFTDHRTLPVDEAQDVANFREYIIDRLPLMVCGSSHVTEWQKMRLPDFMAPKLTGLLDWRYLDHHLNSPRFSESAIAENTLGPFGSDVSEVSISNDSIVGNGHGSGRGLAYAAMQATPDASMISLRSQYSLPRNTNTIPIKRYAQRRNIALVREFGWGVLQLTNPDHCNFSLLHDILFKSYREALETWTNEYFYENYRMSRLASNPDISQWSRAQQMIFQQELEAKHTALPLDPSDASTGGQACTGDQACNVTIASSYPNTAMSGTNMLNANMSPSRDGANGQPQFNFSIPFPPPGRFSPFSYSGKTASQAADFSFTKDRDQRVSDATTLTSRTAHLSVGKDVSDTMSDRRSSSVSSSLRRNRYTVTTSTQPVIF